MFIIFGKNIYGIQNKKFLKMPKLMYSIDTKKKKTIIKIGTE